MGFPSGTVVKNLSANSGNTGDVGSIPASGRSPGVGHRKPLQYSCLENSVDREALWATVRKNTQSWTWQNMHANRWLSYPRLGQGLSKHFSTFWRKYQVEFFFFHSLLWNYISWASQRPSKGFPPLLNLLLLLFFEQHFMHILVKRSIGNRVKSIIMLHLVFKMKIMKLKKKKLK